MRHFHCKYLQETLAAIQETLVDFTQLPVASGETRRKPTLFSGTRPGKRWIGLNDPEGWQLSRVCSAKHQNQFSSGQGRGWREGNTEAPAKAGCIGV
ncbi:hypothetical protein [Pseudomonas sp. B15(2017)]|uniref:hypothetical protein n=1 Tax=Pseudomonas sp. B15(2017) TaxID=1981744 RepID=UPI00111C3FBC|nr:hypothetical protein [Pseudomonas sp. B15(2017)]